MKYTKKIAVKNFAQILGELLEKIWGLNLPTGFREFISYSISELSDNVKEHSRAKEMLLDLQINKNKRGCFIKIVDRGIGLYQSYLLKKIYPKDDLAAIEFALGGLSTKNLIERGFGLYSIKKLIEHLRGEMVIETGTGKLLIEKDKIISKTKSKKISGLTVRLQTPIKKVAFYKIIK
jgi:hypothetical protein